jgi:hypothetical protein
MKKLYILISILCLFACNEQPDEAVKNVSGEEKLALNHLCQLLEGNKDKQALGLLNSIFPDESISEANEMYVGLLTKWGVKKEFLERKNFDKVDLYYLKQSLLFYKLSKDVSNKLQSEDNLMKKLYELVRKRIKGEFEGKDYSTFPMQIWNRGFGVCDRQSWVLCELAYQAGANVYVIYFRDPKTAVSHHTICEVKYKGRNYIIDPLYGHFIEDRKFSELADQEVEEIWKDYPNLHDDHKKATTWVPIMGHDYTVRMQELGKLFKETLGDESPRFGEDPLTRAKSRGFSEKEDFQYWDYPLRLLVSLMKAKEK